MPLVKALHDIVTPDRLYPAGEYHDLPQEMVDDVRPLGAIADEAPLPRPLASTSKERKV